jgi:AAA domain
MPMSREQVLPVLRVGEIKSAESAQRWLIEELWGASAVGVIGGAPKCAKTWLGLDMALSVATGTACLGKYAVPEPGPVLVYLAEDALPAVRERIEGMTRHRGLDLSQVEIHVITAPVLRLDRDPDRARLWETARGLRPKLLLLDPLVRLHGVDENNAGEVAQLLAYFRWLQRQLDLSVLLVHHTRKSAAGGVAAGQGLRGSSDIHAFGDSNLYLRRSREHLTLSSEHRAAPAAASVYLELVATNPQTAHLEVIGELRDGSPKLAIDGKQRSLEERVLDLLGQGATLTRAKLRDSLGVKNERLGETLEMLERTGRLCRTPAGWQRRNGSIEAGRSRSL